MVKDSGKAGRSRVYDADSDLGGTRFIGRHIAECAIALGHRVTLFHRGDSLPVGLPGATNVVGDRSRDLDRLTDRYDAIVDTCGFLPRDVAASCAYLRGKSPDAVYAFISSINAYRDDCAPGSDETALIWDTGDPNATEMTPETYGPLKARCEGIVRAEFGERAFIVRPGLVAGPYDQSDRFTYCVRRIARGGRTLTPGEPERRVQIIDARDLAEWIVSSLTARRGGTLNATGPQYRLSFGALLEECRKVLRSDSEFVWASQAFLLERGVQPWSEMPLWVPDEEGGAWDSFSAARAMENGLVYRDLSATIRDTWEWDRRRDQDVPLKSGITAEREALLLEALPSS